MIAPETLAAIRCKAEVLAGGELGEQGDLLVEMAAERACAFCNRPDIPTEMEQAVAALVLTMKSGEGDVKSLTRGDVTVAYFDGGTQEARHLLAPFRRLGTVQA